MKTKLFLFFLMLIAATQMKANNMLVKNVTTTGDNAANKTIQVQFDMSWDNSWRDAINWDAAWIFMKYKDVNGNWQHVQLNTTGFANGTGTANTIQVGSDKVGAFVYRSAAGTGTYFRSSPYVDGGGVGLHYAVAAGVGTNLGDGTYSNMRLGAFQVYNTALSARQVTTNFQAGRGRYGV